MAIKDWSDDFKSGWALGCIWTGASISLGIMALVLIFGR